MSLPDMKGKRKKVIVGVLLIVIGLPVVLILTAFAWFSIMDRTNGTILSSGVTRRYLLYVAWALTDHRFLAFQAGFAQRMICKHDFFRSQPFIPL